VKQTLKNRDRVFRRCWGTYYRKDRITCEHTTLKTRERNETVEAAINLKAIAMLYHSQQTFRSICISKLFSSAQALGGSESNRQPQRFERNEYWFLPFPLVSLESNDAVFAMKRCFFRSVSDGGSF
jgi:hypothetical protein